MIFVQINDHKVIVDGHAYYCDYGKDIVCSAVSTLFQTLISVLDKNKIKYDYSVVSNNTHVLICKDIRVGFFFILFPKNKIIHKKLTHIFSVFKDKLGIKRNIKKSLFYAIFLTFKHKLRTFSFKKMVRPMGIEPTTF